MGNLSINSLTKVYGDGEGEVTAVEDLDLDIKDGELIVLVGPSGCGKTTTLRCVAGLETITEGDILLNGESLIGREPKDRDMAMVFQNYALYPHMTARENISFGLRINSDLSKQEIEERVNNTSSMMGIEGLLDHKPDELSGGQQQRVALGRAIVREPEVFLMDEPLSNLDAKLRTQMRTEVQELQQELDVTTIYVTHDQTEAMTMGDRIAILNHGELQQIGTPLECYHEPANEFVAGFIGSPSMNFLPVTVSDSGDGATLEHPSFNVPIPLSDETAAELRDVDVDEVTLGIRPEDIQIAQTDDTPVVSVEVDVVEPLGDVTYVYFTLGEETYTASLDGNVRISEKDELDILFPEDRIHLFHGDTGETLKNRETEITDEELSEVV